MDELIKKLAVWSQSEDVDREPQTWEHELLLESSAALADAQAEIARLTKALQDIKGLEASYGNAEDTARAMAGIAGDALSPVKWGK